MVVQMGGIGSGRYGYGGASKVDEYHAVDLAYLNHKKLLQIGHGGTLTWSRGGERVGWIRYSTEWGGLRLDYKTRSWGEEEWHSVNELIPFIWTQTQFGGERRWLQCLSCRRRCRVIYGGSYFRCRRCYQLKYETQYEKPWARAVTKSQKVRLRLGGSGSMDDLFPPKPKGMHWKTYRLLEAQDAHYQNIWASLMMGWLKP